MTLLPRVCLYVLLVSPLSATEAGIFRFVSLPDTQRYAEDLKPPHKIALDPAGTFRYFMDQTKWIVDNREASDFRYVIHLGDIVQTAQDDAQWKRSRTAMDLLHESGIPYGAVLGNHDILREPGHVYDAFLHYYGPERFADKPWYGGASPDGVAQYHLIPFEDFTFLFLNLGYATPKSQLDWADKVLEEHRDKPVIVTTHAYLWDSAISAGRYGENVALGFSGSRIDKSKRIDGAMSSQKFYERFVRKHPNIMMVQCGHSGLDWYRMDGRNSADLPVLEALTDYQILPNGGEGYLRIYEIDTDKNLIHARTYSPTHDRTRTTFEHFVQMIALSFVVADKAKKHRDIEPGVFTNMVVALFKRDVDPERDVVADHPDYRSQRDLYLRLFQEAFLGDVPEQAGQPEDWEALWARAFAADPKNLEDYGPNERSPSFTVEMDLKAYTQTPEAASTGQ